MYLELVQSEADKKRSVPRRFLLPSHSHRHYPSYRPPALPIHPPSFYGKNSLLDCTIIKINPPLGEMLESQFDQILLIHWFPPFTHSEPLEWIFRKKSPNNVWNSIHQQIPVISFLINWTSTREWMEEEENVFFRLGFLPFLMYSALTLLSMGHYVNDHSRMNFFLCEFSHFLQVCRRFYSIKLHENVENANGCDWSEIDLVAICMSASGLQVEG